MGVYAQTHFSISMKDKKTGEKVKEILEKLTETDPDGNSYGEELEISDNQVYGFMSSGRIQNLEYRCEKIWDAIKDIDGVMEINCPFLSEADGYYQLNNDK